jgi:aspartate aminotransferase
MVILCNPLNPTSTVYDEKLVRGLIEEANAKRTGTRVVIDEAYKGLAFKKISNYDGAIRIRSFSKEFNMEGWRLGYAVAPEEIIKRLVAFNQITSTCVPPFIQAAALACLENEKKILGQNRDRWKKRAGAAEKALKKAGFKFVKPDAGIYIFVTHDRISDAGASEFVEKLLEKQGVVVAPGSEFGGYDSFVRICLNQPENVLVEAIEKMAASL